MAEHSRRKKARAMLHRAGYRAGGALSKAEDRKEDRKDITKAVHEHEAHDHKGEKPTKLHLKDGGDAKGHKAHRRLDKRSRGGGLSKGKKGKGKTEINIAVAPHGGQPGAPDGARPVPVPVPVRAPMAPPAGMRPPMPGAGGPAGLGAAPPMAKRGAAVKRGMRKSGGKVSEHAGAGSGEGRLERTHREAKRPGGRR